MSEQQPPKVHEVEVDGVVVHTGPGWEKAFKQAMMNDKNGYIRHLIDGKPAEQAGPTPMKRRQFASDDIL